LAARAYTLVEMDPAAGRFALDFVLHGSGPAASWARQAAPGQQLEISRPLGRARIDPKHRHYLLAGDATALPAIREWLRLLPDQATAAVRVWLPAQSEVQELGGRSGIDLKWFFPGDPSMAELAEAGSLAPAGWTPADPETRFVVAGEAGEVTRVRRAVSWDAKPLPGNLHAAGYWRRGKPSDGAAVELG
jgi:NADPH-dependent ferric siderophore reductase